ncbi:MAG: SagB/ThcOx family dehydrogenase [Rubrivivax sp.]|nr:SagB/ThcOx family dehydrogenase [Rubrivivax sp.]
MNTLTKLALGLIGQNRPRPAAGDGSVSMPLPPPRRDGSLPLMQALALRQSVRDFSPEPLDETTLADVLWAGAGVNRPGLGGRTAPSAMNAQEVALYVAMPQGLYRYQPEEHRLQWVLDSDVRGLTGYQDFVDDAALDLIYVAEHDRMSLVPASQRSAFAHVAAGAMAQNVYLACASAGLATVLRAWLDRDALARAMHLANDEQVLLAQTVGRPKPPG